MLFKDLKLAEGILKALEKEGYTTPTPIQEASIPLLLKGCDLVATAQTGTGKTAAFLLPILQKFTEQESKPGKSQPRALVLAPTRELAIQIGESLKAYSQNLSLRHLVIFGGVSQEAQTRVLKSGVDILVATPGRLLDLMNQGYIDLRHIQMFVLDEADRMFDMGFINDIRKVISRLPEKRQNLFFSATMPPEVRELANSFMINPERVGVSVTSTAAETVSQAIYMVDSNDKKGLLLHLLKENCMNSVIVFTRTKHRADRLTKDLNKTSLTAEAIHGNKSQNARQKALLNFKDGKTKVLVATDIAARGIDVASLSYVVNFDLPDDPETYIHRIGRTGRAGAEGTALSFCSPEESVKLKDITRLLKFPIPVIVEHPFLNPDKKRPVSEQSAEINVEKKANMGVKKWSRNKSWSKNKGNRVS